MQSLLLEQSLEQLSKLPNELTHTKQTLNSQLATLCFQEVNAIITANNTKQLITKELRKTERTLNQFINTTQQLQQNIHHFTTQEKQHTHTQLHKQLQPIQHLIELPQLIATCIHNQRELEAIQLALKIPPPHQNNILTNITHHANKLLAATRDQHLIRLNQPTLSLPTAIRSIHIIRKLSSQHNNNNNNNTIHIHIQPIHEPELRLAFLSSRFITLRQTLNPSWPPPPPPPPSEEEEQEEEQNHLKLLQKAIEVWRTHVGETLSIYHHIFHPTNTTTTSTEAHTLTDADTQLNLFLTQAVRLQADTLGTHLAHIRGVSSLSAVLTQLTYSAAAFRKWGLDFSATSVGPIVVARMEQLIAARFRAAAQALAVLLKPLLLSPHSSSLASASTAAKVGFGSSRRRSLNPFSSLPHVSYWVGLETVLIAPNAMAQVLRLKPTALADPVTDTFVAAWISLFPPLVRYVNAQLAALNELRLLPLAGSYAHMVDAQMDALATATADLGRLAAAALPPEWSSSSSSSEQEVLQHHHHHQQHPDQVGEHTEDVEKRSALRIRSVVYRMLLLWARNILPALEHALRVQLYHQLNFPAPPSRFLDLINQAEGLLAQHFPTLHGTKKAVVVVQENPCAPTTPNDQTHHGRRSPPTPDPPNNQAHAVESAPRSRDDDDPRPDDTSSAAAETPPGHEGPLRQEHAAAPQDVDGGAGPPAGEDG